mgnify:CR=1 FL=1
MGASLLGLPAFDEALAECQAGLDGTGLDLRTLLGDASDHDAANNVVKSFVGIIAMEIALLATCRAAGLEFDGCVGHSIGELACAYADGCITAAQAMKLAFVAASLCQTVGGAMASVALPAAQAAQLCCGPFASISVACDNAAESTTLAGPAQPLHALVQQLKAKGTLATMVNSGGVPFHSPALAALQVRLTQAFERVLHAEPCARSPRWISSSGQPKAPFSAQYLAHNLCQPVRFREALAAVPADALVVDLSPHHLLANLAQSDPQRCAAPTPIAALSRQLRSPEATLATALGRMYTWGLINSVPPAWLCPPAQWRACRQSWRQQLAALGPPSPPPSPVHTEPRQRGLRRRTSLTTILHHVLNRVCTYEVDLGHEQCAPVLATSHIGAHTVVPPGLLVALVCQYFRDAIRRPLQAFKLTDVTFPNVLFLDPQQPAPKLTLVFDLQHVEQLSFRVTADRNRSLAVGSIVLCSHDASSAPETFVHDLTWPTSAKPVLDAIVDACSVKVGAK